MSLPLLLLLCPSTTGLVWLGLTFSTVRQQFLPLLLLLLFLVLLLVFHLLFFLFSRTATTKTKTYSITATWRTLKSQKSYKNVRQTVRKRGTTERAQVQVLLTPLLLPFLIIIIIIFMIIIFFFALTLSTSSSSSFIIIINVSLKVESSFGLRCC